MILVFEFLYNRRRKEKNIMGKRNNEVNGVLVYRRWCAGAIISAITLLLVIAVAVGTVAYNWLIIANVDGYDTVTLTGVDLIFNVIGRGFAAKDIINSIASSTSVKYFALIMRFSLYGMFGFMALVALFGIIEFFFFVFYIFTGRVVNPAAPVKIAWVTFAMSLIYSGLSFGLAYLISFAYAGSGMNFLQFLLGGLLPKPNGAHVVNFFWPLLYTGVALIGAILISIVYAAAFKDKYYIGRAKRFGSGEVPGSTYETNNIYNNQQPAAYGVPAGSTPQVIVVNGNPNPAQSAPIIATIPGQPPVVVQAPANSPAPVVVQNGEPQQASEMPAQPVTVLPTDLKSIGGHAFSKNLDLKYADIPNGIKELGVGAFANCLNLEVVSIPKSVRRIKKNCFFNCARLVRINYEGTKTDWRYIVRGSNWLDKAGTKTVICSDGAIIVDPHR